MKKRIDLAAKLKAHDVRPTSQRLCIAEATISESNHVCAEDVLAYLKGKGAKVSKATVYNTLQLFCEKGLLRTINVDPERQFYDSTTYEHHHLYNVDTGELIDVDHADILVTYSFDVPDGTQHLGTEVILKTKTQES